MQFLDKTVLLVQNLLHTPLMCGCQADHWPFTANIKRNKDGGDSDYVGVVNIR